MVSLELVKCVLWDTLRLFEGRMREVEGRQCSVSLGREERRGIEGLM